MLIAALALLVIAVCVLSIAFAGSARSAVSQESSPHVRPVADCSKIPAGDWNRLVRVDRRLHGRHAPRLRTRPICKRDFNQLRRHVRTQHRKALVRWRSSFRLLCPNGTTAPSCGLASWYGPGFYGNRTACGQTYSQSILGVAHKSLPCGTKVWFSMNGHMVLAPVIDRGPYVGGRTWDLSAALKARLGCSGVCTVKTTTKPRP
jgi:rare lipoprotein A (peptidoglycan hydrolase)